MLVSVRTLTLLSLPLTFAALGCKARSPESSSRVRDAGDLAAAQSEMSTPTPDGADPFAEGFTITRPEKCNCPADKKWDDVSWPFAYYDASGAQVGDSQFALDQGTTAEGDVVFTWPKSDETISRDYARVEKLMKEYSELVGTCLHRTATGAGEEAWLSYQRSDAFQKAEAARSQGSTGWCKEVVAQLVDRYVPTGSKYRQYGNCGEGGRVGACLAKRAGFKDEEIRLCLSKNDHFFGMVYRGVDETGKDRKWCILDRWDLIGNFNCDVDLDFTKRYVTHKGQDTGQNWFQKANCTTLDKFIKDPYASLYNF